MRPSAPHKPSRGIQALSAALLANVAHLAHEPSAQALIDGTLAQRVALIASLLLPWLAALSRPPRAVRAADDT